MENVSCKMKSEKAPSNVKLESTTMPEKLKQETKKDVAPSMSQSKIMKNVLIICLGFFFLYLPFQSLANLQSSLNVENNIGILSQTIIYTTIILSALFLPKLIIKSFGCKNALIVCILTFIPYFVANFYPHLGTFIPTAILLGIGAGPLWSAKCTYVNEISILYAAGGSDTVDVITPRFFGIFFMIFQNTQIWGNLISFYVLKPLDSESNHTEFASFNETTRNALNSSQEITNLTCGAYFCGGMNENLLPPSDDKRYTLITVYSCSVLLSAIIVFLFLDPIKPHIKLDISAGSEGFFSRVSATLKHLKNKDQFLLVPLTIFNGMEQGFILGDYSKAFVACAWGIHNVGLVFICYGIVNAAMSFLSGRLVKYVPRAALFITGALGNAGTCVILLLWQPHSEEFIFFFVLVGVWGMSDAIWLTQINALYGVLFREEEEAAFANFKLWESVGFSLSFGSSIFLCINQKIYILLSLLIVGITGYITVEIRNFNRSKIADITIPS